MQCTMRSQQLLNESVTFALCAVRQCVIKYQPRLSLVRCTADSRTASQCEIDESDSSLADDR